MAASPTPPAGAQPQGGAPPQQGQQIPIPLQLIAGISRLAKQLAEVASPCSPECQEVISQMQKCAQKIMGSSQQQQAGPTPY